MIDPIAAAAATTAAPAAPTTTTETTAPTVTAPTTAAPAAQDWTASFNEDLKGYVANKGFKDPVAVLDSYRNLEKLLGVPQDQIIKLPKEGDAEGWGKVYEKLGRPAKADEYKVEGVHEDFANFAKSTYHEIGLTKAQAEKFTAKLNEYAKANMAKVEETTQVKLGEQQAALKKEWGAAFEQNVSVAKRAASAFGATPEIIDALEKTMGFDGVMRFMHGLGSKLGEDSFHSGGRGSSFGVLTPAAAKERIGALRADPDFTRRYVGGDASAREEMARLHEWAYSGN